MCCDNVGFSEHCESIWNSATRLASYRMEITGWICIELLGLLGIVCHSDGNGGSSVIDCVYDVPAAYQFVPANAGMPPRRYADALGPAWLHSAFGKTMIGQPLGCFLVLGIGFVSFAIGAALLWCINVFRPGMFAWEASSFWAAGFAGFLVFYPLLDFGHKLEIRIFFKKR